jgi:hypothetical protein
MPGLVGPANAACATAAEQGLWENQDPGSDGIVRIEIVMVCQPLVVNGIPWPPGSPWHIRVFERCGADLCDWGEVSAEYWETRHVLAIFDRGQAQKRVWLRIDPRIPSLLYAYVYSDFYDLGHANSGWHYWFQNPDAQPCTVRMTHPDWERRLEEWFDCVPKVQVR